MKNETVKMIVGIQENKNCKYGSKMMVSMKRKHEAEWREENCKDLALLTPVPLSHWIWAKSPNACQQMPHSFTSFSW